MFVLGYFIYDFEFCVIFALVLLELFMAFQQLIGFPGNFFKAFCQLSGIFTSFEKESKSKKRDDGPDHDGAGAGASGLVPAI